MHVAVLGAGALGTLFGASLWRGGGAEVTLLARGAHREAMAARGVGLIGGDGAREVLQGPGLRIAAGPGEVDRPIDYLIVAVKGRDFAGAMETASALPPVGCALTLQNGIRFERGLADVLGAGRVIGAMTMEGAEMPEPGTVRHMLPAVTYLGERVGEATGRVRRLAEAMEAGGLPARVIEDVAAAVWTKFVQSCAASGVCGVTRLGYAPATATAAGADLYVRLVLEGLAVMRAEGLRPGPYLGDAASPQAVGAAAGPAEAADLVRRTAARLIDAGYVGGTSLLRDLEAGRPTEAEYLMGDMVRTAAGHRVPVPTMAAVHLAIAAADQSR
ncbi:MAG: 2-dehydropantoate 2-reductase [Actinobacteria bacterium]|nr:2-dehydropantoate 2-reductase [Actinomycetota bacterium]